MARVRHARLDAHDGLERQHGTGSLTGLQTIEADSRPDHVKMHGRIEDGARRVVAMHDPRVETRIAQAGDRLGKTLALQLMVPSVRLIGRGEMRERAVALQPRVEVDAPAEVHDLGVVHADAVHAGVDGHVVLAHLAQACGALPISPREFRRIDGRHDIEFQ